MAEPAANPINSRSSSALQIGKTLGRFELKRLLGQGAQSMVWLAHDPRMEREVAIKVLRPISGVDEQAIKQWLQEARSVGKVKHPSIVPVFEADIQDEHAYLVFEYVAGGTLAQLIARKGALPAREAVAYMLDVLDAIAVAHAEGVVHRDIKPSNILVDSIGRARIMDFGIAAHTHTTVSGEQVALGGTLGYLSPEAIDGAQPVPSMDLFACGLVLAELLLGKPLVNEAEPSRAIYRLANEQLLLPPEVGSDVDDSLRALVNRALVRDPLQRFPDARSFFNALNDWRLPPGDDSAHAATGGTLEFLLRRMRHKSDFPALSESVVRIQNMAASETESVSSVTNQILKDVALTNKLLRVVNTAHYARSGAISTVSRAVTLVGFNGIRNMALSLVLLEHMQDKAHAAQIKDEFVRSLLAGTLGAEMCATSKEAEEAFIGAMFQNMGRLLVQFYFPEEAAQVRALVQTQKEPLSEELASLKVLGMSYENLGLGIAKAWGLPESIQRCMRQAVGSPPSSASLDPLERLRWVATASNEMADVLLKYEPADAAARIALVARKYAHCVGTTERQLNTVVEQGKAKLKDLAGAMEIRVKPDSAAHKVLHGTHAKTSAPVETSSASPVMDSGFVSLELHATEAPEVATPVQSVKSTQVAETLAAGIQDITNAMVEDFKLTDVLRMVLETMYRAMGFDRIIFCMRDPKNETVTGRFGLGDSVETFVKDFKVPLKAATPDLFAVVCMKGMDSMISDASESRILSRLPPWYLQSLNAPAFLLLPLQIKSAPFGLIYADKTTKGALDLNDKELGLLRTLRNQAVMAFKQSR
jgi:serine/threonine protein kinase